MAIRAYEPRAVNRQRRTNAEVDRCHWDGCNAAVTYSGRGRPPKYCPEHAKASKQSADKRRPDSGHTRKRYPQCCLDAQAAEVRTYGTQTIRYQDWDRKLYQFYTVVARVGSARVRPASVRMCAQHQQWRAWYGRSRKQYLAQQSELRAEKNDPQLVEVKQSKAFRLTMGNPDDYIVPTRRVKRTEAGAKVGYDDMLERQTREWLARN